MTTQKKFSLKTTTAIVCLAIILTSGLWYAFAVTPTQTQWFSGGIYSAGVSWTVWRDGSNYFAKNAFGFISSDSGTNATTLIMSICQNDTTIFFTKGTYLIKNSWGIRILNKRNLHIIGEYGTIFKKQESGIVGQIMEIMRCSQNVLVEGIIFDQDRDNPNHQIAGDYGLQWNVRVGNGSEYVTFRDCQFINGEQCLFVTGNGAHYLIENCFFNHAGEHPVYISASAGLLTDMKFHSCTFLNWGEQVRGYVNIGQSSVIFSNCYFEDDADGDGLVSGSYAVCLGIERNGSLFSNCIFMNPWTIYIRGNSSRFEGCDFINTRLDKSTFYGEGNMTVISGCDFENWTYRILDFPNTYDLTIQNCRFSGGVTNSIINMGTRTSVIGCIFVADTTNGNYGINDASGTGVILGCHICNGTLTFNIPAGVEEIGNIYD